MRLKMIIIGSVCALLIGCSNTGINDNAEDKNTPPTSDTRHQDENHVQKQNQNDENEPDTNNSHDPNKNFYTNDTTEKIKNILKDRSDIREAQVASTDTRVMIALQLSHHADRDDILDSVENDVKDIASDKEMVIYTDDAYWNRMKDRSSKFRNLTDDDVIDEYIDEHFFQD